MRFALPNDQVDAIVRDLGLLLSLFPEPPRQFGSTYRAKCPIHGGAHLSLGIKSNYKGWGFTCFACGAHGSAIDLCRAIEGCGFKEALAKLGAPDRRSIVALWTPPKPKDFVMPCEGKGCGARLELDRNELAVVDVAYPSWRFDKLSWRHREWRGLCPRCALKLAQDYRRAA